MGQKVNPTSLRLGIIRGWDSNWYSEDQIQENLREDEQLRNYLHARLRNGGLSRVIIERTPKRILLTLMTSRPGVIIGKGGEQVELLREELRKVTNKDVQINISEIKRPETDANLVAQNIVQQLESRISFRRAMKTSIASAMRMGAEGIKVKAAGRLGGAEMARVEQYKEGRVPLHTFRADIDYAVATAQTIYGSIGVKVWIFKGEIIGDVDLTPSAVTTKPEAEGQQEKRRSKRSRGGGQRRRKKS
ncbi:30S ribosomal protein S3 [Natronogracilivirga saccharolytica]|uniref:Small ribosomal subunit protein uS3 n=1 Tax=Natronogracilivirga saccharolytica TaxID=2812953 RepID=A0A8J7S8J1_9BACT|nr:30S ribosomal protein S3 [Natronogracilivirga saccharolytica]MBP3192263.1 30S ribosomal protein S3 [Natronogracilivirga saccharolytica]